MSDTIVNVLKIVALFGCAWINFKCMRLFLIMLQFICDTLHYEVTDLGSICVIQEYILLTNFVLSIFSLYILYAL